jgi:hypothetical protein
MRRNTPVILILLLYCVGAQIEGAQDKAPSKVAAKTVKAIGFTVGGGKTTIDFKGTELMPAAMGRAKVKAKQGYVEINVDIKNLAQPTKFGAEFLTYVLWAVSPEGHSINLGELIINKKGNGKLKVSTQLPVFSLLITAEPYFAVRQPSEILVLENEIRSDTAGTVFLVKDYKLMEKAQYQRLWRNNAGCGQQYSCGTAKKQAGRDHRFRRCDRHIHHRSQTMRIPKLIKI